MEIITPPKKTFMARLERYEPVVGDHSARILAKTCLRKYFYRIVLGRVPKEREAFFAFGSAYHKFRELLEKTKDFTTSIKTIADWWKRHGQEQPVGAKFDFLTLERLLKSCLVAHQAWEKEKKEGRIEVIAVEQNFDVTSPTGYRTTGKADQIIRWNGKLWGRDFKTSSRLGAFYSRTLEPNDQLIRYTWAEALLCGEPIQGQIVEVMYNTKKEGPKIEAFITSRTEYQLQQWEKEQLFYEKVIELCRTEDVWPMEEVNCAFCKYRSVCTAPTEGAMVARLESDFIAEPWDNQKRVTDEED